MSISLFETSTSHFLRLAPNTLEIFGRFLCGKTRDFTLKKKRMKFKRLNSVIKLKIITSTREENTFTD
jgi:hypothetical protein